MRLNGEHDKDFQNSQTQVNIKILAAQILLRCSGEI